MNDALEMQVLVLRDLADMAEYAQEMPPLACTVCWQLFDTCVCPNSDGVFWPVGDVATRLENILKQRARGMQTSVEH